MRLITAAIAATLSATTVLAADLPARKGVPYFAEVTPNWTGFYLGLTAGWLGAGGKDNGHWTRNGVPIIAGPTLLNPGPPPSSNILTPYNVHSQNGGLAMGVTAGYNMQLSPQFVMGLEADISGLALTGTQGSAPNFNAAFGTPGTCTVINCLGQSFSSQWLGLATERARIGFLLNPSWLIYGTAGAAEGLIHDRYQTVLMVANSDNWRIGWTAGLGTEYLLSQNVSIKAETLYVDLGSKTLTQTVATLGKTAIGTSNKFSDHAVIARIGMNYKF